MLNDLKDAQGRTWNLAINITAVKEFEDATGIKIFAKLFELWETHRGATDTLHTLLAMTANLFPGIEDAAAFIYACARLEGSDTRPSFKEFCDVVGPIECGVAIANLTDKLKEFMPQDDDRLKKDPKAKPVPLGR